ncbi:short-chain dehydrogenase [Streptomyces viridochromogenes]|uniref:Short-chain dehydrogenase n=1 Tax=Streptomyces viridochromogenes TaxID=1938 RepID=A0A0J7Z4B6_STRVR|nr:SDR family oxidoreductase [Streptomyces viridochromogenes]KMS70387.1 short-chain dehydrogenase [Streptomyces viridochromogenes]KOG19438.1 short-chain dehydrogenase [Streptomyces viridochromogenes]KOG19936.1 short-chain dehydrogenase [Streptomyces viridochromogenes]
MTTALITGSTAGIGAAFARRLAADGHDLVLVARDTKRLREQATELHDRHGIEAKVLTADLAEDAGIETVTARLGDRRNPVDLLINNAGFGNKGRYLDVSMADELKMLKVHCEAVLRLTSAAAEAMRERGRGGVVNVASVAAFVPRGTYGASKAWVVQFTQGAARDLAGSGVRLMALCPGFVRTEFHERAGMGTDNIPGWMWLDADKVAATALEDLARGRSLSIPDPRYKVLMGAAKLVPRGMLGGISSKTGRKYGPQ